MNHLTLVTVETLACFSHGSPVQGERMLLILLGIYQESLMVLLGLDTAQCLAGGETASHLAMALCRELPRAWAKTRPEALFVCVWVWVCVCVGACVRALCSPVLSCLVLSIGAAVILSTVSKVVVLLMQEPELLFYLLL